MPYCTQQDMTDRFGSEELIQLTDRSQLGQIDATVLGRAIDDATDTIDTYLTKRYTLPLASIPTVLKRLCCDIARYYLHGLDAPDGVDDRHSAALALLKSISTGAVDLAVGEASGGDTVGVAYETGTAVFDETQNWP